MAERQFPAAFVNAESKPYWDAAANGKLMIMFCKACKKNFFYPRSICPFCSSQDTEWKEASGKGEIYSHSTMRRVPEPYTLAYVTLAEGPHMLTNIVDCDYDKLAIGQKVHVVFKPAKEGPPIPAFAPD
jgi:uncharacterized OB-fold protein